MMAMLLDLKYALRQLYQSPRFTAMTLGVLLGGLSIALFTFSFLYTTIYKPLPLPDGATAKRLVVYNDGEFDMPTAREFQAITQSANSFAEIGIFRDQDVRLSKGDAGRNFSGTAVQGGFFEFSRTKVLAGRTLNAQDSQPGAPAVAVLSEEIWDDEFNRDPQLLGQAIELNGVQTEVVGIMPSGYRFPDIARIWLPLPDKVFDAQAPVSEQFDAYIRLKEDVDIATAEREITQTLRTLQQQNQQRYGMEPVQKQARILTFQMAQTGGEGATVFFFLSSVSWVVLLLACINVGNLLLARILEKQKETAIRNALGASSRRLIGQLMWEGVLITLLGTFLSVCLVGAVLDYVNVALRSWLPGAGLFWWQYGLDGATLLMALAYMLSTVFLAVFLPAWRSTRQDINATLRDGTRGAQSRKAGRLSRILVTTQVFLVAILMLIGSISALIANKFVNLDLGDDYQNVMSTRYSPPEHDYPSAQQRLNLTYALMNAVQNHNAVTHVSVAQWLGPHAVYFADKAYSDEQKGTDIDTIAMLGDFQTTGVQLLEGRLFNPGDTMDKRKVVIISESMAKRYWSGQSALEQHFTMELEGKKQQVFVVGVVSDLMNPTTLFGKLDSADEIYISGSQFVQTQQKLSYRILPGTRNADEIFYQAMYKIAPNLEVSQTVMPAIKNRDKMRESMKFISNLTFATGAFALVLAVIGIYGLTANAVAQRTHEIGIRRAVGARDSTIVSLFMRQGAVQLAIGLGLALLLFALLAMGFQQFTEGLFPAGAYFAMAVAVSAALAGVVLLAVYIPIKRAIKLEPVAALRYE
ncbi:ABC transporter permease [Pseudoalteromonas viridis]|nr:ABC transporter permease [Pseudoalteromonas viridis]